MRLADGPEVFGEWPLVVDPLGLETEIAGAGEGVEFVERIFVAGLGPDGFTGGEGETHIEGGDVDDLIIKGTKMHFDAVGLLVEEGLVFEPGEVEIAAQFPVDAAEQIEIEGRGNAGGVVVSGKELFHRLDQVRG